MDIKHSVLLFEKAKKSIPGGVNSPVRAFKSVGGSPVFIKNAKGAWMFDEDENAYIDLINSWGPMLFGHAPDFVLEAVSQALVHSFSFGAPSAREVEMAETLKSLVPSLELVRMVNSGTEATMAAIRLARGFTGRDKILKFEGCYHGHGDSFLIAAGSGALTYGIPDSKGITKKTAIDTLTAAYNDLEEVEQLILANPNEIAAVILEPVVGNMGLVLPKPGFLEGLRALCSKHEILLIFDEVMTGFRLAKGGAQELFDIKPDLSTFGKIIGGGFPVGAYGGRKDIMECVAPLGPVYQAGTLSGNPIAMTAGLAMLNKIKQTEHLYQNLETQTEKLLNGIAERLKAKNIPFNIQHKGSMFTIFFTEQTVWNLSDAKTSDTKAYADFFHHLLAHGVYGAPSQFEAWFVSTEIQNAEIQHIWNAVESWRLR